MDTSSRQPSTPGLAAGLYLFMLLVIIAITIGLLVIASPVSAGQLPQEEQPTLEPPLTPEAPADAAEQTPAEVDQSMRPPQQSDEEEITRLVFAKIGANREMSLAFLIYEPVVDNIQFNEDRSQAAVWLAFRDPETGEIIATEPAMAIANRREEGWAVTTMVEEAWLEDLSGLSPNLITEELRSDFASPPQQEPVVAAAAISGYKLPWAGGTYNAVSGSIGHVFTYKSCPTTCLYAFDFADGTMWPIVAARAGKVKYAQWKYPNGNTENTNYIVLEDSSTTPTTYQVYYHLAQDSIPTALRTIGTVVNQGQFIGTADDTGYSTGHHLHFHVHTTPNAVWGTSVDITFADVLMNGGRPRTCAEARDYPSYGNQCVTTNKLLSGNKSGPKPAAPAVIGPSGQLDTNQPTFTWSPVSGALQYYLAVTNTSTNALVLYPTMNESVCVDGVCSYTPASPLPDGYYTFSVRAGAATGWSAASESLNFRITLAPPPPELVYPTGTIRDLGPSYTWKRVEGATYYYLVVHSAKSNEDIIYRTLYPEEVYRDVVLCNGDTCAYKSTINVEDGDYTFSVQSGNALALSEKSVAAFTVTQRPITPSLLEPNNSALWVNAQPTFRWQPSESATTYNIQFYSNTKKTLLATYTVKSSACSPTACAYTPTTKVTAGSYKWRARAGNSYGYSVYGDWLDFTVQLLPSTPTTLLQPAVNATIDLAQPQYVWNAMPNTTTYTLQLASITKAKLVATYTIKAADACVDGVCTYQSATTKLTNGLYKWRLRSGNSYGYSFYGLWQNFTVQLTPGAPTPPPVPTPSPTTVPGVPPIPTVLTAPAANATITIAKPDFVWNAVDGATRYSLQLASVTQGKMINTYEFTAVVCTGGVCTYPCPVTLIGEVYKWRVRSGNAAGNSFYAPWQNFTIQLTPGTPSPTAAPIPTVPPTPTTLTSPAANTTIMVAQPDFVWNAVDGATRYSIQLASVTQGKMINTYEFTAEVCTGGVCTYPCPVTLTDQVYKWRVRSGNAAGNSFYAPWQNFTVQLSH